MAKTMIHRHLKLMTGLLGVAALLSTASSASASIVVSLGAVPLDAVPLDAVPLDAVPLDAVSLDDISLDDIEYGFANDGGQTSSSGSSSSKNPGPDDDRVPTTPDGAPFELHPFELQLSTEGSTSGTSTSTSSTNGANTPAFDSAAVVSLSDPELVAWIGGEQRPALPMPLGNELLRPPQG